MAKPEKKAASPEAEKATKPRRTTGDNPRYVVARLETEKDRIVSKAAKLKNEYESKMDGYKARIIELEDGITAAKAKVESAGQLSIV